MNYKIPHMPYTEQKKTRKQTSSCTLALRGIIPPPTFEQITKRSPPSESDGSNHTLKFGKL